MDELKIHPFLIDGAYIVQASYFEDKRGFLKRLYAETDLKNVIGDRKIVSINLTKTIHKGTVRGLHFQRPPHAEVKMVRCLNGQVLDVIVDVRVSSSTYLKWESIKLSSETNNMIIIPEGVAHGFQTLEDNCEVLYFHTASYSKESEGGLRHDDPALNIEWPVPVTTLSDRDKNHPLIDSKAFKGIKL